MSETSDSEEFDQLCCLVMEEKDEHDVNNLNEIEGLSLEALLRFCAVRIVSDPFLRLAGKNLYSRSYFLKVTSHGLLMWLFGEASVPFFFT